MWRAYGGTSGVALIFNSDVFISSENANLPAYTSPVLYATEDIYHDRFHEVVASITNAEEYVKSIGRAGLKEGLLSAFLFAVLATKHPGFSEEREWRVTHSPELHPSDLIKRSIENCRGEPQIVYKIRLQNDSQNRLKGMELSEILDSVIIGPTANPDAVEEAFVEFLSIAGHADPRSAVRTSNIPLRL
jgi:hypothetical protein